MTYEKQLELLLSRIESFLVEERRSAGGDRRQSIVDMLNAMQRLNKPIPPAAFWMPGQDTVTTTHGAELHVAEELRDGRSAWTWRVSQQGQAASRHEAREAAERAAGCRS